MGNDDFDREEPTECDQRSEAEKLDDFDREEREAAEAASERQPGDVDFTDYVPDPELASEYFGGFKPEPADEPEGSLKACPERAKFLYLLPVEERGFDLYHQRSPGWAAELPREDVVDGQTPSMCLWLLHRGWWPWWRDGSWVQNCSIRFYAPSEARDRHGVQARWPQAKRGKSMTINVAGRDYRIPILAYVPAPLDKEARPPRTIEPRRATSTQPDLPFALQAVKLAEQLRLPPEWLEKHELWDRAEEIEAQELRQALPGAPTSSNRGPSEGFAWGIQREHYKDFQGGEGDDKEWTDGEPGESPERWDSSERWSQQPWKRPICWYTGEPWTADWCGPAKQHRPSKALEEARFPILKRLGKRNPDLTNEYLYGGPQRKLGKQQKRWSKAVGVKTFKLVPGGPVHTLAHYQARRIHPSAAQPETRAQGVAKAREFYVEKFPAKYQAELKPTKAELRAYLEMDVVAKFFAKGGLVTYCPAETTTRMLTKRGVKTALHTITKVGHTIWITATPFGLKIVAKRMGRPRAYKEQPMTAAQRKARSRAMQVKTSAPNGRPRPDAIDGHALHRSASGLPTTRRARRKTMNRELSSRVTRSEDNMIHVVGFPTPKGSKPLIGELTITAKPRLETVPRPAAAPQPLIPHAHPATYHRHSREGLMAYVASVVEEQLPPRPAALGADWELQKSAGGGR
jgi:hypothetical protein